MDEPQGLIEKTLPLVLTGREVVYLTDAIANGDVAQGLPDKDAYVPLARDLLLILGSCYREVVYTDKIAEGPCCVEVTEEQAWLMRSKVRTADLDMQGKNIGISLSLKLYALLLAFHSIDMPLPVSNDGMDQLWTYLDAYALATGDLS